MDRLDREILGELVKNARASYREIGERVSLSANATADRIRRMRESGVITGFEAIVDPAASGRTLVALIDVRLDAPKHAERFERLITSLEEITDGAHVTGRYDYQLRAACRGTGDLDTLIRRLKTDGGVVETETRLALRTVVRRPSRSG